MKAPVLAVLALFALLFVLTTFVPYPPAIEEARAAGFSDDVIDTGLQFTFERRLFFWASAALQLTLLSVLALTRAGRRLADHLLARARQNRVVAALLFGLVYWLLHALLYLPLGILRLYHAQSWEMSNLTLGDWLRDYALSTGITCVIEGIVLAGFYTLLIVWPRTWWLFAPVGGAGLAIAYAFLSPILVNPLFNDFTPLQETKWKDHQPRVQALIDKADVPVREILVMNGSRQGNHTNAYFTGFGPTRRIVLYDTLLSKHSPEEIESVLAHELGHWRHDHIVKGILLGSLAALAGCFVLHLCLRRAVGKPPWELQSLADPAGLPLVLLLVYLGTWVAGPVGNLVSRHFERQADQASLELADVPQAFIAAERNLARANKANVAPTPWNVWLFSTHPTTTARIRMAQEWQEKGSAK